MFVEPGQPESPRGPGDPGPANLASWWFKEVASSQRQTAEAAYAGSEFCFVGLSCATVLRELSGGDVDSVRSPATIVCRIVSHTRRRLVTLGTEARPASASFFTGLVAA